MLMQALAGVESRWAMEAVGRLTAREQDVVQWLSTGKTDRDIAAILGISPRTVHKHLQRIYEKLGVETRTAAVARVLGMRWAQLGQAAGVTNGCDATPRSTMPASTASSASGAPGPTTSRM